MHQDGWYQPRRPCIREVALIMWIRQDFAGEFDASVRIKKEYN